MQIRAKELFQEAMTPMSCGMSGVARTDGPRRAMVPIRHKIPASQGDVLWSLPKGHVRGMEQR